MAPLSPTPIAPRTRRGPQHARPRARRRSGGVEGNARLTGGLAAIIFWLLAAEGVTLLSVQRLLSAHVVIGAVLIPPVAVKIASTTWRMLRYYTGHGPYRRKGPPRPLLRLLGPVVVILTVVLLVSGVGLVVGAPVSWRPALFALHRATFVAWFAVMVIHVLAHLGETARIAPRDWLARTRRHVDGATSRQWVLATSLAAGLVLGLTLLPFATGWRLV
ncbi:MAG: hypothetical protein ACP5OV_02000 [Acidimicrobiales bacterium]